MAATGRRLALAELLNPSPAQASSTSTVLLSSESRDNISSSSYTVRQVSADSDNIISVRHNVNLNRKTTLAKLYTYKLGTYIEYPETGEGDGDIVGHLFQLNPLDWKSPSLDFSYSRGPPKGKSKEGEEVSIHVLDDLGGKNIPCVARHSTCRLSIKF